MEKVAAEKFQRNFDQWERCLNKCGECQGDYFDTTPPQKKTAFNPYILFPKYYCFNRLISPNHLYLLHQSESSQFDTSKLVTGQLIRRSI